MFRKHLNNHDPRVPYFGTLAFLTVIINIVIFWWSHSAFGIEPAYQDYKVTFTDPLYEDWIEEYSQFGSTALFDLNSVNGQIKDICGTVEKYITGRAYDTHLGWDRNIPNDSGDYVIFAPAPGIVEKVYSACKKYDDGCMGGAGNFVFLRHNSKVVSKFFHIREDGVIVKKGQWVDRHAPLGYGGSTGESSGEHLHMQVEVDGEPVDLMSLKDDWIPPLAIMSTQCKGDPQHNLIDYQSLREYALTKIAPFDDKLVNDGYVITSNLGWLKDTSGGDQKDILIQTYEVSDISGYSDKKAVVFDLSGHAPAPILFDKPVLKWWYDNQSVYGPGKPIAVISDFATMTDEIHFEKKVIFYNPIVGIKQEKSYPENAHPGEFSEGMQGGLTYAIIAAYKKNGASTKVGYPTGKDAQTPLVHKWGTAEYLLQDFSGGSYGSCGIMLQKTSDNFKACLIRGIMWGVYRATGNGPEKFGYPLNDQYFDSQFGVQRQDFEKGLSILESGEIIASTLTCPQADATSTGVTCKCPGNKKTTICGKCGTEEWTCKSGKWSASSVCQSQGVCIGGDKQEEACGQCGGTRIRTCGTMCQWNEWSVCSKLPAIEICDSKDNDCDGKIDEENVCCAQTPEICNGKDDNCNGKTDEELALNACGGCKKLDNIPGKYCGECGVWKCENGELACKSFGSDTKQTSCGNAKPCGVENWKCVNGMWVSQGGCTAAICQKDETKIEPCGNCGGVKKALCGICEWSWGKCSIAESPEVCDQQDNDCDGKTDEDKVCCAKIEDVCDYQDDDCNGVTDEGVKNACGGCSSLKMEPGKACGTNSAGTVICDGLDAIKCNESPVEPPPDPPIDPPPVNKNECGGQSTLTNKPGTSCEYCGTWQCSGTDNVACQSTGQCLPGTTSQQSCQVSKPAGSLCSPTGGTITTTCNSQCQWQAGTCTSTASTQAYAFESKKACGNKYCFRIDSVSGTTGYGRISKPSGTTFGNFPLEWFVMNTTTSQVMGMPPGFGCSTYYTGQSEGNVTFSLNTVQGKMGVALETHSNSGCNELDITPSVYIEKCN